MFSFINCGIVQTLLQLFCNKLVGIVCHPQPSEIKSIITIMNNILLHIITSGIRSQIKNVFYLIFKTSLTDPMLSNFVIRSFSAVNGLVIALFVEYI